MLFAPGLPTSGDRTLRYPPADQRAIDVAPPAGTKNLFCSRVEALAGDGHQFVLSFTNTFGVNLLAAQAMCPQSPRLACAHNPHKCAIFSICALCSPTRACGVRWKAVTEISHGDYRAGTNDGDNNLALFC